MQMKTNLRVKVGETAWPDSNSAPSAALITLIMVTMKAQVQPWQQRHWGKTKGQIRLQEAGTDPDQQMVCNNDSIRRFCSANRAEQWLGGHRRWSSKGSVLGEGFLGACWTSALVNLTSGQLCVKRAAQRLPGILL